MQLDRIPLWRGDHVDIKKLWDDFATYVYLPRLRDRDVLAHTIREALGRMLWEHETFAYADAWDAARKRYIGLVAGQTDVNVRIDGSSVLVKPDVARQQMNAEPPTPPIYIPGTGDDVPTRQTRETAEGISIDTLAAGHEPIYHRFHGMVEVDPLKVNSAISQIAEAVIQHLNAALGAEVTVTVEIAAESALGFDDTVRRNVSENAATLKFSNFEFEES